MSVAPDSEPERYARPFHEPADPGDVTADPFVYFVIFGARSNELDVDPDQYGITEIPDGIEALDLDDAWIEALFEPPMGEVLRADDELLAAVSETSDRAILVTGSVDDPPTLGYLRDVFGIVTAALDVGGASVLSMQSLTLFSRDRWRDEVFAGVGPIGTPLVKVLYTDVDPERRADPDAGTRWVHTRGLRLFGRPDLSIHGVPADQLALAHRFCQVLIEQLARGLVIDDGARMQVGAGLGTISFRVRGELADPEFNNVHLEIDWPAREADQ